MLRTPHFDCWGPECSIPGCGSNIRQDSRRSQKNSKALWWTWWTWPRQGPRRKFLLQVKDESCTMVSQVGLVVKNLPARAGDKRDVGSVHELGRSSGEGNGNLLQYSRPGKFHGWRSLAGYSPRGLKESDTTDHTHLHTLCCFPKHIPGLHAYVTYLPEHKNDLWGKRERRREQSQ